MKQTAFRPAPRRRKLRNAVGLSAMLVSLRVGAQAEVEKPQPNVLLLVDTSGSMEFKTDGTFPTCNEGNSSATNEKSRWIELVEVLTGQFEDYSCWAQDRSSAEFLSEFSISSVEPYDFGYNNPYHRAISNGCVYGAGFPSPSSTPFSWEDKSINTFPFSGGAVQRPDPSALETFPGCSAFSQLDDGLLDVFGNQVRFGLMTFDTRINAGTGLSGTAANISSGMEGTWSYFVGDPVTGSPANCSFDLPQEIGARNAAAPAWEGRMVAFGAEDGTESAIRNQWVQDVLLSTRPYGATPVAGLLQDAKDFLWNDTSLDPLFSPGSRDFGPANDPSWRADDCRKSLVILLTDGEPNLDLRPSCEEAPTPETAGRCPYDKPEQIADDLRLGVGAPVPSMAVETYVIGFALGEVTPLGDSTPISCDQLTDDHCSDAEDNPDDPESKKIRACCTLNLIANKGSVDASGAGRPAYFANNRAELRQIFSEILDDVVQVATRTKPVFSDRGGDNSAKGFKFFSAFNPNPSPSGPAQLWEGVLNRSRFVCTNAANGLLPEEQGPDSTKGDDFAKNLAAASGSDRIFYSFSSSGDNRNSQRPELTGDPDDLGSETGTVIAGASPADFVTKVTADDMGLTDASCGDGVDAAGCRNRVLKFAVGLTNEDGEGRCLTADNCSLLGGIYHSTPTVVSGRPAALLRDDSYRAFVNQMATNKRPSTLYTSTVDGFLHAFELAPHPDNTNADDERIDQLANNELWSFVPPAVLPTFISQYPATPIPLLDGRPIVKEVVARTEGDSFAMERTLTDAQAGNGLWRTVLVQSFGEGATGGGYFAVDVTDPRKTGGAPKFLWQLTRTGAGTPLFGSGGTPLITTVFVDDPNSVSSAGLEVAVAVLPGGAAAADTGPVAASSVGNAPMTTDPASFTATLEPRAYTTGTKVEARTLTIVRLDTGEILRSFRPVSSTAGLNSDVVEELDIPSPIVGQPVAFPSGAGALAERVFVGDADGRLYRVDLSDKDPANWTMRVFFDSYPTGPLAARQPIELPPVVSINDSAEVTVAVATGEQETIVGGAGMLNYVTSLTEKFDGTDFVAKVNWQHELTGGMRVTGPMVLFNKGLYYAASRPPDTATSACDAGASEVFAVHYELDEATQADPTATADLTAPGFAPGMSSINFSGQQQGLIFGVSLESQPSCSNAAQVISGDEGFGYGEVTMSTQTNTGKFFLSYEASGNSGTSADAVTSTNGVSQFQTELATAQRPVTFESFALIYE